MSTKTIERTKSQVTATKTKAGKPKWDDLNEEEREAYVNQDTAKRGWMELVEGGFGNRYFDLSSDDHQTHAEVCITAPDALRETIEDLFKDDPYTLACAYSHWVLGMKFREIADEFTTVYRVGDQEYFDKKKSEAAISKVIQRARKKLIEVGRNIDRQ